ncbi:carboxypeptidase-like regulatory domain-containing protein [Zobellia uliginosa]
MPGVNVVAGTKGAITDFDGKYELNISNDIKVIEFSSLGFAAKY